MLHFNLSLKYFCFFKISSLLDINEEKNKYSYK